MASKRKGFTPSEVLTHTKHAISKLEEPYPIIECQNKFLAFLDYSKEGVGLCSRRSSVKATLFPRIKEKTKTKTTLLSTTK